MKRKGQITIPQELRVEFDLDEGAVMDIDKENNKIVITPLPPIEPGEPVGEEEFKKIIAELDERRRNWR
jgi:AbrB family looped-hinge helix DNA binding protein